MKEVCQCDVTKRMCALQTAGGYMQTKVRKFTDNGSGCVV